MALHTIMHINGSIICEIEAETVAAAVSEAVRRGISLAGAYMAGANMEGANMEGANMAGANMEGAKLSPDQTITSLVARATRIIEPYEFFLWATDNGPLICAGCRTMAPAEYRVHIAADGYDDAKHAETARILDYFDAAWVAYEKDNAR